VNGWLGVVSREHVQRGVALGIAQLNHGQRAGLQRMQPGDWLAYYSPRTSHPDGAPLRAFTAIGRIADSAVWEADEGNFHPFRRRVDYEPGVPEIPLADVTGQLELTRRPNWGYALRRGLLPLSEADIAVLRRAMLPGTQP